MIAKAVDSLKKNPVLIAFYCCYMVVAILAVFFIYPKNLAANTDPVAAMGAVGKMLLVSLLMGVLGLVFFAGYGKMMADAVVGGKTFIAAFTEGIKKFFVRVLLAALLLLAFYLGFAIVMGIVMIPVSIMLTMGSAGDPTAAAAVIGVGSSLIVMVIGIFVVPFVLLWYPAIFMDDVGVMEGLRRGAKAGVKSYWRLVTALFVLYIPSILYTIANFSNMAAFSRGNIFTPGYIAMCLISSIIGLVFIPFIFVAYDEKKLIPEPAENEL